MTRAVSHKAVARAVSLAHILVVGVFCAAIAMLGHREVAKARERAESDKARMDAVLAASRLLTRLNRQAAILGGPGGSPPAIGPRRMEALLRSAAAFHAAATAAAAAAADPAAPALSADLSAASARALSALDALGADLPQATWDPVPAREDADAVLASLWDCGKTLHAIQAVEMDRTDIWRRQSLSLHSRLQATLALYFVAAALLGLAGWTLHARVLERALRRLGEGTRALAAGRMGHRFSEIPDDEVGAVMSDFNRMAARLAEQQESLLRVNAELEVKARELAELNRHKDRFLAAMSHELRTPLSAVIGFADLLRVPGDLPAAKRVRHAERILKAAEHLLQLIGGLLDVAKIDAGVLQPALAPVRLGSLAASVADMLRSMAEAKGLALTCAPSSDPLVLGDERMLRQVLINLVGNAIKFTDKGSVSISLDTATHQGAPFATVAVRDTGIGISEADQPLVFRDFHRVETGLTARFEGTGLGLTLSKRLVDLHGGWIKLESAPGAGSTFTVGLPCARPTPDTSATPEDAPCPTAS